MRIVAVNEWLGAAQAKQQAMLPASPGLYVWMLDLRRPLGDLQGDDGELLAGIRAALNPPEPKRFDGRVRPYTALSLHDDPPPLTTAAESHIEKIASMDTDAAEWALLCPTMLQRPLYIGKSKNIRKRLRNHLNGRTKLAGNLRALGLSLNDCAIMVAEVQPAPSEEPEEVDVPEEPWDDLEDESLEGLDPTVSILISAAESLTIRMSRPLLNERMD